MPTTWELHLKKPLKNMPELLNLTSCIMLVKFEIDFWEFPHQLKDHTSHKSKEECLILLSLTGLCQVIYTTVSETSPLKNQTSYYDFKVDPNIAMTDVVPGRE